MPFDAADTAPVPTCQPAPACRHCHQRQALRRRRRLCRRCFDDPSVRALYPSTTRRGNVGIGRDRGSAPCPLPTTPTAELPGSPAKIAVLAERARLGQQLFHPLDVFLPADALALLERADGLKTLVVCQGATAAKLLGQLGHARSEGPPGLHVARRGDWRAARQQARTG